MPKPNESSVEDFLSQVNPPEDNANSFVQDESDPLGLTPKEPKEPKAPVTNDDEGDDTDDKPVAFHKDPKVLKFIEKEVGKRMKNYSPAPAPAQSSASQGDNFADELTATLTQIIGNDTPERQAAIKSLHAHMMRLEERGANRALQQIQEQAQQEKEQEEQAYDYLQTTFEEIEEQNGIDFNATAQGRKLRGEFVDFIARISPKDENGDIKDYPDIQEAWSLFSSTRKPADNNRAKDIASRSMARSSDAPNAAPRGNTWKDVDRIFSKLAP